MTPPSPGGVNPQCKEAPIVAGLALTRLASEGLAAHAARVSSRLRILATSDLHAQMMPWDYYSDQACPARGLVRTAGLIAQARDEGWPCLLLDNGDFLQGSPLSDLLVDRISRDATVRHPMITAMNALGYDAATLGNHEFTHGLPFLINSLAPAAFPVVSANIALTDAARPELAPPFVILGRDLLCSDGQTRHLRIGVIGFAPPQLVQWDHHVLQGQVQTRDILLAAAEQVPRLRAAGADIVVALSHSGIGPAHAARDLENASAALALETGIDVLITGHTHQVFPSSAFVARDGVDPSGFLSGKPAVMPGFFGSHLGVIDLDLTYDAGWRIAGSHSALRPIAVRDTTGRMMPLVSNDVAVAAIGCADHTATLQWARLPVGHTGQPLHSFLSMIAPSSTVRLVARAQAEQVERALRGTQWQGLTVLAAAAPFRAGGRAGPETYTDVPAGPVLMRHVADLYLHPNALSALEIAGAEVADWLERSVSLYYQITPGAQDAMLVDPDFPSFNFDSIEGVTYCIDLSQPARHDARGAVVDPAARRIKDLCVQGQPIDPGQRFVMATNSYRTGGSAGFAAARPDRVILTDPRLIRDMLRDHVAALPSLPPDGPPNWQFLPMPGTTVLFDCAPQAADHLAEFPQLRIEPLAALPSGFRRYRLHL